MTKGFVRDEAQIIECLSVNSNWLRILRVGGITFAHFFFEKDSAPARRFELLICSPVLLK